MPDLLRGLFSWAPGFKEYFGKSDTQPSYIKMLHEEGFGADCSSLAELILAERTGIKGEEIMFTSNDTPAEEFKLARELGAVINLDDISHIEYLERHAGLPEMLSFRYNPGPLRKGGNAIIGTPENAKYGLTRKQLLEALAIVRERGVKRFGLHTMVISNELDPEYFIETARMMFELALEVYSTLNIRVDLINLGGGIGIPYRPEEEAVDLAFLGRGIRRSYEEKIVAGGLHPVKLAMESGRMITGPYGYLVATVFAQEGNVQKLCRSGRLYV